MSATNYKQKLTEALRGGMRYCFPQMGMDGRTTYPELVESEFTGEDGEGFLHFIQSILFNARRQAYRDGYASGYRQGFSDFNSNERSGFDEKDELEGRSLADEAFLEYDRE